MNELKTLKDLKREENNGPASMGGTDIVEVEDLKQEAIKWVEKYYHPDKTTLPMSIWLDFFNITEKDLKNV